MALVIGNQLLDAGLGYVSSNADRIYICSAEPTTYAQATSTYAIGYKNFGVGSVAGAPQAATGGRKVVTNAVTAGVVASGGTPVAWAIVDTVNSLLLATGPMSGAVAVTTSDAWTLDAVAVVFGSALSVPSVSYDAATTAWAAAVVTAGGTVSTPRKTLVDALVVGLKGDGVWTILDRLWLFAAENSQSALIDLVALDAADVKTNGSTFPAFTIDRGYKGDGVEAWIDTTYNPVTHGVNFTLNSASIGVWDVVTSPVASMSVMGQVVSNDYTDITPRFTDGNSYVWVNQDVATRIVVTYPGPGLLIANRSASNATQYYRNGASVASGSGVSTVRPNTNLAILVRYGGGLFSSDQVAAAMIGGSLNGTQQTALYTRLRTYMAEVAVTAWVAAVAAAGGTVSSGRQAIVSTLIKGLDADGIWAKLDRLWLLAAEDSQSALIDIKSLSVATAVNSPTFAANAGYTFDGSTNYINTGFNTFIGGSLYTLNSAHIAVLTKTTPVWAVMGNYDSGATGVELAYYTGQWHANGPQSIATSLNGGSTATGVVAAASRTTSNARALYVDGTSVASDTEASGALANQTIFLGGISYIGGLLHPSTGQLAFASIGAGLDATENANLNTRIKTYMASI